MFVSAHAQTLNSIDDILTYPVSERSSFPYTFFAQTEMPNMNGLPSLFAPDAEISGTPAISYHADGDSLIITVQVNNIGSDALQSPLYISAYENTATMPAIATDSYPETINAGETKPVTLTIRNFTSHLPLNGIVVRINDNGSGNDQSESAYDNNELSVMFVSLLLAHHDYAYTVAGIPVKKDVLTNDIIPAGCFPVFDSPVVSLHGVASIVDDSIFYTSDPNFVGVDTLTYSIACGTNTSTAYLYIYVAEMPDNISDENCYTEPPKPELKIEMDWRSAENNLIVCLMPLVGDLNNDGFPEVVCFNNAERSNTAPPYGKTIVVYDGRTHTIITTITLPAYVSEWDASSYGLVKTPDRGALIVAATSDLKMRAYDVNGMEVWETQPNENYGAASPDHIVTLSFADFNNDGYPEVYLRDKIYNASTGRLLATATGGVNKGLSWADYTSATGWRLSAATAADVTGDARLELILGNEIYDVDITNPDGVAGNLVKRIKHISPPATSIPEDGHAQAVDFNLDGHTDIFISNRNTWNHSGYVYGYVWDVYNNTVSAPISIYTGFDGKSIPLIADVDNDGKPEVIIQCGAGAVVGGATFRRSYICYKYNKAGTGSFQFSWDFIPDEDTYSNSITMFDFNHDGKNELLLIDQYAVRILDGATGLEKAIQVFGAATAMQYPIIADVNNNGSAQIISIGISGSNNVTAFGYLNVFKSANVPWAPARKVWNQYMYSANYVNDDLTVPAFPVSPATVFPGKDGIIGTLDDVRPYNNIMQQQTVLNNHGLALWTVPNAKFVEPAVHSFTYYAYGDSLVITADITNVGDAALTAPFYIAAYNDIVDGEHKIAVDSSMTAINVEDTATVTLTIRKFSKYTPINNIILRINDRGKAEYVQLECDTAKNNNQYDYSADKLPMAVNDTVAIMTNSSVTIGVKGNDMIPVYCASVVPSATVGAAEGSVAIVDDSIKYIPKNNFYGVDSIVYRIECVAAHDGVVSSAKAKAYIIVSKPISDSYIGCMGGNVTVGFENIAGVEYFRYSSQTGGLPDEGPGNTFVQTAPGELWIEVRYKGKAVEPRRKITVQAYPSLTPGSITDDQTICYNGIPAAFTSVENAGASHGTTTYQWQYSTDDGSNWNNIAGEESENYTPADALVKTTQYRRSVTNDCETVYSNVVTVAALSKALLDYPDIRVRVCPDNNRFINMSRYLDTLLLLPENIEWKSLSTNIPILNTETGTISIGNLLMPSSYTFTYTVSNLCATNITRKVYLETLRPDKMRPLKDTIKVCYLQAEAMQINQLFGIEAYGAWEFAIDDVPLTVPSTYISKPTSPAYDGAVIMNGNAIFKDFGNATKSTRVTVKYTPASDSCLNSSLPYSVEILLNPE
jgi:hypothetical protein